MEFVNSVAKAGKVIFDDNMDNCRVHINNISSNMTGYEFLQNVSTHYNHTNTSLSVSSNPRCLCFCKKEAHDCSIHSKQFNVPQGRSFKIYVVDRGVFEMPVPAKAAHSFERFENIDLFRRQYNFHKYKSSCYDMIFQFYTTSFRQFIFQIYPSGRKVLDTNNTIWCLR